MVFQSFLLRSAKSARATLVFLLSTELTALPLRAQTLPDGGTVRAGTAQISTTGSATRIDQTSERAIIDWRSFAIGADGRVVFVQPSAESATLNRVTGEQASLILGRIDANGQIFLVNPNGILFGKGAQVNVGSLVASTSNLSDANFMAGRLIFDQPGRPGAGILNAGALTAAESGLVALVAPHVRNDGAIVARLGTVTVGAADTFTVDLYGDALINLALSDAHAGQLRSLDGRPVTSLIAQAGTIDAAGGRAILLTARNAKNVLDELINMSGTVKADTAIEQGGRILLVGEGGAVDVSGHVSARGTQGGSIDVLGDRVHVAATGSLDASGTAAGGSVHIGGAFQGRGDTYRSTETVVDAGATIAASALDRGTGGEAVVWSDGRTEFAGAIEAKGGATGGDGGRMEVSGKSALVFHGQADASSAKGQPGSLLLDPAFLDIGATEAGVITRVLRTGTSTNLAADVDITVNSAITGGDRATGGGLTMTAGNNININDFVVTHDGAINLFATQGTVNVASGKAVFAGAAPITVKTAATVHTAPLITGGSLSITSTAGSVALDTFIDGHAGPVSVRAAGNVDINQPIANLAAGSGLDVEAGNDINVNAPVDGRGGSPGGAVTMTASRDVNVNESIVASDADVALTARSGKVTVAEGKVLVAGTGAVTLNALGDITTGAASAGSLTIASSAASVHVNGLIDGATGDTRIDAALDVDINQPVLNGRTGQSLAVTAGRDVNVGAQIDARGGAPAGNVSLTAARNLNVNEWIATNGGSIHLNASGGAATIADGKGLASGGGAIAMRSAGDLTAGIVSGGSFAATSSNGTIRLNGLIDAATGRVDLAAGADVQINEPILNLRTGNPLNVTAGRDIAVNAPIDGRDGASGGAVSLTASRDVALNSTVVTAGGEIVVTAAGGSVAMATGTALVADGAPLSLTAGGDVTTGGIRAGTFSATSTGGSVNVNGVIDSATGRVDLNARRDVNINKPVQYLAAGAPLYATAGGDVNVNAVIATRDGAINLSALNGRATVAPGAGLFAGTSAIALNAFGDVTTGVLSAGPISVVSHGGAVNISGPVAGVGGPITIGAAAQVDVAHAITNPGASSPVTITAGTDINLSAPIDGRTASGTQGSAVTLTAGQNVFLNDSVNAQDAPISVTATGGTVVTAPGEGLFAGSGAILVESGQTLSTGITSTTGTLTLRSTNGSVNVDTPISGDTGAVTIAAAADVNVNQALSNKRSDAPLNVTAGRDINVNAAIDGRDAALAGASGTTTLTAGNNATLNESIVTRDSAITLTAQNGTIVSSADKGLFAGSGAITETSGQTLTPGVTETTGALTFRSTQGGVNIDRAIGDTTGAVTIDAATAVNINHSITNLKSGANLSVAAGTDINVLGQVDGRSGTAAGGAVTMTAQNHLNIVQPIATNDGAVALTATTGAITMPTGVESLGNPMQWIVSAGNAPVTLTSGANFSLTSPISTTGSLAITSTNGNINIAAPITDNTGAVTITAGDGVTVNHQVKSNNQPITFNAGSGGIVVNRIADYDQTLTAPINSLWAPLTFNSVGNVAFYDSRGIATGSTLTIDTRGAILTGIVGDATTWRTRPQSVIFNADRGIGWFDIGYAGSVAATSIGGSISVLVDTPGKLRITTGTPGTLDCPTCNITVRGYRLYGQLGPDVALNAGGSVSLPESYVGRLDVVARSGDFNVGQMIARNLTATVGRDVNLNGLMWIGPQAWPSLPGGPLVLTAGRDINTYAWSPIHISEGRALNLTAGQNVTLNLLETLGAVDISALSGNITLNNDIGPHIVNHTAEADFNPFDLGVASLTMSAPASTATITMQGARAEGDVTITTGGSLTAAREITSVQGTVSITTGGTATIAPVPIGTQEQVPFPNDVLSVIGPGPKQPLPTSPGFASGGALALPALTEISVAAADQILGGVIYSGAAIGVDVSGFAASAAVPGIAGGSTSAPGSPSAPPADTSGAVSSAGNPDSANAKRDAEQDCAAVTSEQGETGLDAIKPQQSSPSGDKKTSACMATPAPSRAAPAPEPTKPSPAPESEKTTGGGR